jgi:hypothetical protein
MGEQKHALSDAERSVEGSVYGKEDGGADTAVY